VVIPLLKTKLYIPKTRPDLVSRPRLIERLNTGMNSKLILISAPAGFGKTTLLCEWVEEMGLPTSWISLDEEDNDFTRFLTYLITALQGIYSDIDETPLELLRTPQNPSTQGVFTVLLNQLEEIPFDFLLVIDDYHLIEDQAIHHAMDFLISYLPSQMHLVLVSRADPPLHLARLRGQGQLLEVRMDDLRFHQEECAQFLQQALDTRFSESDVSRLLARTEGWVTGLQMAALSLQGHKNISTFVDSFSGSHRYILDYLIEEVLQRQTDEVRTFLYQTSILPRLNGDLCNAVTGREDSQAVLAELDRSNLFVIPLDEERAWYRYHRLFSDLLQARLEENIPDQVTELHRRASHWFAGNGFISFAIDHALSAGDYQQAIDLIEGIAERTLLQAQVSTLLRWRDRLPGELVTAHPDLAFIFLWAQAIRGYRFDEVQSELEKLGETHRTRAGRKHTLQAFIEVSLANLERAGDFGQQALDELDPGDVYFRSIALWAYAMSRAVRQNLEGSYRVLEELLQVSQVQKNTLFSVLTASQMGRIQMRLGNLVQAERIYQETLEACRDTRGKLLPIAGEVLEGLGELYLELNQLDQATDCLLEGIELTMQWREVAAMEPYISLSRVKQAQGDWEAAQDALDKAMELAVKYDIIDIDDRMVDLWQARLWLAHGDLELVQKWVEKRELDEQAGLQPWGEGDPTEHQLRLRESLVATILHIKQGNYIRSLERIEWQLEVFQQQGRAVTQVELLLLKAEAMTALGEDEKALEVLEKALEIGERAGYLRTFLDQGQPVRELLGKTPPTEYVRSLLTAFEGQVPQRKETPQPLIDPLSERELEVLRLLPTNLTTPEIAEELFIGVNTVRSHIKSIYGKLGVHKRSEAVSSAKELGLF
jgi:LuxR family maltose regulon positive regulatory protein